VHSDLVIRPRMDLASGLGAVFIAYALISYPVPPRRRSPAMRGPGPRPALSYARLDAPISSMRNTGWSLGSGSLVKHGSTACPQTFR
jgi:hypothetical protein